ncbi:MAG: sulfatase-like hydrolase/transferase [Hyphomicrobiaceae bacterium]
MSPSTALRLAGALAAVLAWSFWKYEGLTSNVVFTAATTLALGALIVLVSRRILFAAVVMAATIVIINGVSSAKQKMIGMVLHAYDIVFYLGSWSTVTYLWFAARGHVLAFAGAILLLLLLGAWVWRLDPTRARRSRTAVLAALAILLASYTGMTKPDRRHTQFYWDALYVSSFYGSWAETLETLWRGHIVESAHASNAVPFVLSDRCDLDRKPPHIVLIHQESVVQPGLFPTLNYDRTLDQLFKSDDGQVHKMRVETYGGASWLTEFSILTGLSTHSFGGMRPFVQSLLAGKVRDTLPETLERCGYRNVLFYPMLRNFVSNARFYDAIGLKEIFDLKTQQAKTEQERDRFYYDNALNEMQRHVKTSQKPLFTYIQTMSVHWPYDWTFEPDVKVAGGGPGTDPDMSEYLRRVAMAKMDYDYLIAELKRRFPGEPILVMHYGDHHPTVTQKLLGYDPDTQVEDLTMDPKSAAFITYFAVQGINHALKALPPHDVVDVPYLGTILLEQAGLPLSPPNRERARLMRDCDGHYHGCVRRTDILSFHRRLIDSKLITSR